MNEASPSTEDFDELSRIAGGFFFRGCATPPSAERRLMVESSTYSPCSQCNKRAVAILYQKMPFCAKISLFPLPAIACGIRRWQAGLPNCVL